MHAWIGAKVDLSVMGLTSSGTRILAQCYIFHKNFWKKCEIEMPIDGPGGDIFLQFKWA
jgi:hypothetical protein